MNVWFFGYFGILFFKNFIIFSDFYILDDKNISDYIYIYILGVVVEICNFDRFCDLIGLWCFLNYY